MNYLKYSGLKQHGFILTILAVESLKLGVMGLKSRCCQVVSFWRLLGKIHFLPLPPSRGLLHSLIHDPSIIQAIREVPSRLAIPVSRHLPLTLTLSASSHQDVREYPRPTRTTQDDRPSRDPQSHLRSPVCHLHILTSSQVLGIGSWPSLVGCLLFCSPQRKIN